MRTAVVLLLLPLALLTAACGGSTTSATGTGAASGADVTPADAIAFVSLNTDESSEQWQQADELLQKFPIRSRLLSSISGALADENLDYDDDVRPALGPTLDLAVITAAGKNAVVGMTQPEDEAKLVALLEKGAKPTQHAEVDGWIVFSDNQAALAAFSADGDKLADSEAFDDAMGELPDGGNAKVYFSGAGAVSALGSQLPQLGAPVPTSFDWVSLALSSQDDGWKIDGAAKGGGGSEPLDRSLLEEVPSGALVALLFNGSNTTALDQLRKNPALSQQSAQLEQLLGIRLEDVVGLLRGNAALYVRPGTPFPEVTLLTKPDSPEVALETLDRAGARIALLTGNGAPKRTTVDGVEVRQIDYEEVSFFYGVRDDTLIASTSTAPFRGSSGASLEDDPAFSDAADAVGLPDEETALVYANIRDSVPAIEGLARAAGDRVPPELSANLSAVDSFIAYSTTEGDISHFTGLLQVS